MIRFDEELELAGNGGVDAHGPLDPLSGLPPDQQLVELCAWVFQRGGADAAATEMSTTGGRLEFPTGPAPKWRMLLGKVGDHEVQKGEAFAVAVALMRNHAGEQRIVWWGHPVTLVPGSVAA